MKFGQLIEYNMRNIFHKKSYTKFSRETIQYPFLKNQNWAYLWIYILNFIYFVSIVFQVEDYQKWLKLSYRPFAFTSYKTFLKKTKRGLELVYLPHFLRDFRRKKYYCCYILLPDQISMSGCLHFVRYWAICILYLFVNQDVTSKILKLSLSLQLGRFFYMTKMSRQNFKYLENGKSF